MPYQATFALATAGAAMLQAVLDEQDDGYAGPRAGYGCGGQAVYAGSRPKTVTTVLGPVRITRAWYHCAACQHGFAPRDRQLGLRASGALSPGLAEMSALAGAEVSFTDGGPGRRHPQPPDHRAVRRGRRRGPRR